MILPGLNLGYTSSMFRLVLTAWLVGILPTLAIAGMQADRAPVEPGGVLAPLGSGVGSGLDKVPSETDRYTVDRYRNAAEAGHAWAQFRLGLMYAEGEALARDARAAVYWFRKAAAQEHAAAQYALGVVHAFGHGVAKDEVLAVHWFRVAAEQGYPLAQHDLGLMYYKGMGVEKDDAEAVRWWMKAAEQGNAPAQSKLGAMYIRGTGVPRDHVQAYAWISIAAARGDAAATKAMAMIDEILTPGERERARQLSSEYRRAYDSSPAPR
ncbi:MAG: hypothetical protein F4X93_03920 [Proteobacteria bacterium]|nr:hypothetical protein [Pseudomonadota bacterium]